MTSEEFWTVPFKREVTNEDGHQFAGLIVTMSSGRRKKKVKAAKKAEREFDRNNMYNGPVIPDGLEARDIIAKSEVHRSTAGEIFRSNISMDIEHKAGTHSPSEYDHYSRYHFPDPENGPSREGKVMSRYDKLDIRYD